MFLCLLSFAILLGIQLNRSVAYYDFDGFGGGGLVPMMRTSGLKYLNSECGGKMSHRFCTVQKVPWWWMLRQGNNKPRLPLSFGLKVENCNFPQVRYAKAWLKVALNLRYFSTVAITKNVLGSQVEWKNQPKKVLKITKHWMGMDSLIFIRVMTTQ